MRKHLWGGWCVQVVPTQRQRFYFRRLGRTSFVGVFWWWNATLWHRGAPHGAHPKETSGE